MKTKLIYGTARWHLARLFDIIKFELFGICPKHFPARLRVEILTQLWRDLNLSNADARMEFLTVLYSQEDTGREQIGYRFMAHLLAATHNTTIYPRPQKFFLIVGESLKIAVHGLVSSSFRRELADAAQNRPEERHPQQEPHAGPQIHIFLCCPPEGEIAAPAPPQNEHYTAIEKCGHLHIFGPDYFDYYFERFCHTPSLTLLPEISKLYS